MNEAFVGMVQNTLSNNYKTSVLLPSLIPMQGPPSRMQILRSQVFNVYNVGEPGNKQQG